MSFIERILKFVSTSENSISTCKDKRGVANISAYEKMKKNRVINTDKSVK